MTEEDYEKITKLLFKICNSIDKNNAHTKEQVLTVQFLVDDIYAKGNDIKTTSF